MKKLFSLVAFALLVLSPIRLLAWSTIGHRVVVQIAEDNVKSGTKKKINKLLDNMPMAYWANWPDFIKSDKTGKWDNTFIWHYVNTPKNLSKEDFIAYIKNIKQENLYSEVPKLKKIIEDKVSSVEQKRTALIFLIHLIGDAHQPMHVGCADDRGGNKVTVYWFNDKSNLHSVWDSKLIDYEKYSYTEYAHILNILPKDRKKQFQEGTLIDWLYESHCLANEIYGSINDGDTVSYEYSYKYKPIVELQLQKAGLRLASILDEVFR